MSVEHATGRKTRARVYLSVWLFVLSSIAFMDRGNIAIAGKQIMSDFGLDNVVLGTISTAFLLGYAFFQMPAGWMAAKYGPRKTLTLGVLLWAAVAGATSLLSPNMGHSLAILMALRFLLGVGEAVMYPSANQFVARWIPTKERGKVNGLIFAGVGAGTGLTPPLVNWIIHSWGWHAAFLVSAILFLIGGIVWFVFSRDTPHESSMVSAEELSLIEAGIPASVPAHPDATTTEFPTMGKPPVENKVAWGPIFRRFDLFTLMGSYFCFGYISWIFFAWFFQYLIQARGVDAKTSSFYAMLPPLAMLVCCLIGGFVSDKVTQSHGLRVGRCGPGVVAMLLTAIFLLIGSHIENPGMAAVVMALGAGTLYLAQSSYWSVSADIAGKSSGVFSGLVNMGAQLGGALTARLTPAIAKDHGWTSAFVFAACLAVLGAILWTTVHPERPLEQS